MIKNDMSDLLRGQVIFRNQGPVTKGSPFTGFVGLGILEVAIGALLPNRMMGWASLGFDDIYITDYNRVVPDVWDSSEFGNLSVQSLWPSATKDGKALTSGGLLLRRCNLVARKGCECFLLLIVGQGESVPFQNGMMYEISGNLESGGFLYFKNPVACPPANEKGMNVGAILKKAVWGFGDEKYAFLSTMGLYSIRTMSEVGRMNMLADERPLTNDERERHQTCKEMSGGDAAMASRSDKLFESFKRKISQTIGLPNPAIPISKTDLEEYETASMNLMREIIKQEYNS